MRIKEGVSIIGLQPEMTAVVMAASVVWQRYGQELVVTGGTEPDGGHGKAHLEGRAMDLRTRYFDPDDMPRVAHDLEDALGGSFEVKLESDHIHVQLTTE